ncbi:transposase [Thiovibrio sp. JS02]
MARPLRIEYPGALYHVTNRGNERKPICKDDTDRQEFLALLARSLAVYSVKLYSFVLMNNHFHLLVETPLGNLSQFMRHFNISYTSAFNRRHRRSGHLYQGRYKSFLVDGDAYLSLVSRYIHLNPVKVGGSKNKPLAERLDILWAYKWSSLPGFVSLKKRWAFVDYPVALAEFGGDIATGRAKYKKQLAADLAEGLPVRERIVAQSLLGSDDFVQRIKSGYLDTETTREQPTLAEGRKYLAQDVIIAAVCKVTGKTRKEILQTPGPLRQMAMDLLYRLGGMKNPEIGRLMGVHYSTVSQGRKRFRQRLDTDRKLYALYAKTEKAL